MSQSAAACWTVVLGQFTLLTPPSLLFLHHFMGTMTGLWTEELLLSGQKFKNLHGLLNHAQFKPLIGQRRLSEVGTKERASIPAHRQARQATALGPWSAK